MLMQVQTGLAEQLYQSALCPLVEFFPLSITCKCPAVHTKLNWKPSNIPAWEMPPVMVLNQLQPHVLSRQYVYLGSGSSSVVWGDGFLSLSNDLQPRGGRNTDKITCCPTPQLDNIFIVTLKSIIMQFCLFVPWQGNEIVWNGFSNDLSLSTKDDVFSSFFSPLFLILINARHYAWESNTSLSIS